MKYKYENYRIIYKNTRIDTFVVHVKVKTNKTKEFSVSRTVRA